VLVIIVGVTGCGATTGSNTGSGPPPSEAGANIVESDAGGAQSETKLVFVSSVRYTGNMGGLAGADTNCQSLAAAAGRQGQFRAWLSTLSTPAWMRLTHSAVPYVLRSGAVVANDWSDFTSGTLRHAIDETEGDAPPPNSTSHCNPLAFWTATDERGAEFGPADCTGWTDATDTSSLVVEGVLAANDPKWSTFCYGNSCGNDSPIVCLEQ
jgi:hypothetical protein